MRKTIAGYLLWDRLQQAVARADRDAVSAKLAPYSRRFVVKEATDLGEATILFLFSSRASRFLVSLEPLCGIPRARAQPAQGK
jgi:hypothetical protein